MSNKQLAAELEAAKTELEALKAEAEELRKLKTQAAQVQINQVRKQKVIGLGLVFGEGQPRMEYQDRLFEQNELGWNSVAADGSVRPVHFTDAELLILNHVEHPMCTGRMELDTIRAMRRLYNEGRHSKAYAAPVTKSRAYTEKDAVPETVAPAEPVAEPVAEAVA